MIIITPSKDDKLIDSDPQTRFRSSVGSILYLVKISRPDLSNISRELSKVMMKCTSFHYSSLIRTLKYIEKTLFYGILYKINRNDSNLNCNKPLWELTMYSDSDWAGDTQTRKSISGWSSFLEGCIII